MAINPYFMNTKAQQDLYEDIIIESVKIYGQDVYYLPRETINYDTILNEDVPSRFSCAYRVEMYIDDIDGFAGEGDIFTKFGVEIRDAATFVVARRRWKHTVAGLPAVMGDKKYSEDDEDKPTCGCPDRPREGDLIWLPMSCSLFQINHVEHEVPFYQLGNLPTYKLRCELFEYNDEDFDTGIPGIDHVEKDYAYTYDLTLDSDGQGFTVGENVSIALENGVTLTGEVTCWNDSDNILSLVHVGSSDGSYQSVETVVEDRIVVGTTVVDSDGSGNDVFSRVQISSGNEVQKIDENEQAEIFDNNEPDFLDFTESNPFGDPS